MDKNEFKRIIREIKRKHNLANDKQIDREIDQKLSSFSTSIGTILEEWQGKRLKNVGKHNAHHYRRRGVLYVAVRDTSGIVHLIENSTTKTIYAGVENSLRLTSVQTKNSNQGQSNRLDADFLSYKARMIKEENKI